jgi:hypothetical protein
VKKIQQTYNSLTKQKKIDRLLRLGQRETASAAPSNVIADVNRVQFTEDRCNDEESSDKISSIASISTSLLKVLQDDHSVVKDNNSPEKPRETCKAHLPALIIAVFLVQVTSLKPAKQIK